MCVFTFYSYESGEYKLHEELHCLQKFRVLKKVSHLFYLRLLSFAHFIRNFSNLHVLPSFYKLKSLLLKLLMHSVAKHLQKKVTFLILLGDYERICEALQRLRSLFMVAHMVPKNFHQRICQTTQSCQWWLIGEYFIVLLLSFDNLISGKNLLLRIVCQLEWNRIQGPRLQIKNVELYSQSFLHF